MSLLEARFCVYVHRLKSNHDVIYVGQGSIDRAKRIKTLTGKSKRYDDFIKSNECYSQIIAQGLTKAIAEDFEQKMIRLCVAMNMPLLNRVLKQPRHLQLKLKILIT